MAVLSASGGPALPTAAADGRGLSARATRLTATGAALALAAAVVLTPHEATSGPVVCPFRLLTGLPCPGCGMTRAWVFAMHGDLGQAVSANPFVLVALPAAVALVSISAVRVVRRRPPPDVGRVLRARSTRFVLVAWIGFGVVRALLVLRGLAHA